MQANDKSKCVSAITNIIHSFEKYAIIETCEHRCILVGESKEIGNKCLYINENETIYLKIDYQYSAIDIDKIRKYFKKNSKGYFSGRQIEIKVINEDPQKKGIAISIDLAERWGLLNTSEVETGTINDNVATNSSSPTEGNANDINHYLFAKAIEDGNLEQLKKLVLKSSNTLTNKPFQGDRICLQLEIEAIEPRKIEQCVHYLVKEKYFSPVAIGTSLIDAGTKDNKSDLIDLGFAYNGFYQSALKNSVRQRDENKVKSIMKIVQKYKRNTEWEEIIKIAEAKRDEPMIQLLLSYGAKRTPWSPQNGHFDSFVQTEDSIEDIKDLSPFTWRGGDWNDETD